MKLSFIFHIKLYVNVVETLPTISESPKMYYMSGEGGLQKSKAQLISATPYFIYLFIYFFFLGGGGCRNGQNFYFEVLLQGF